MQVKSYVASIPKTRRKVSKMDHKKIPLTMGDMSPKSVPREVRQFLTKESRVLELGCGRGAAVIQLKREGYLAKGYEVERSYPLTSQKLCQEIGIEWNQVFDIGDSRSELPYENDSFDLVWTDQVLEHVDNLNFFLSEVSRVLRPGGIFWARFPSKFNLVEPHSGLLMLSYSLAITLGPKFLEYLPDDLDAIESSGGRSARAKATYLYLREKVFFRTVRKISRVATRNGLVKFRESRESQALKFAPKGPGQLLLRLFKAHRVLQKTLVFRRA